jgi:hypothetical protein
MKTNYWSINDMATARKMNMEGKSARDIGRALGRSRNSVIGWFHRAGISLDKVNPNKPPPKVVQPKVQKPSAPKPLAEPFQPRLFFNSLTNKPIEQPTDLKNVPFMKISGMMCRSVVGEPKGVDTIYCGEPTVKASSSWCAYHHSIFYGYRKENVESKITQGSVKLFN